MAPKKIVLADDDPQIRRALSMALEDLDYSVQSAKDGKEALELIAKDKPDLLITDGNMPVMDGRELIQELNKKGYAFPIIVNSCAIEEFEKNPVTYSGRLELRSKGDSVKGLYKRLEVMLK